MKVSKRQHSVQHHFTFANKPLDTCKSYTYLGSLISDNDNLKLNINEIFRSGSRAMYNLLGNGNKHLSDNVYILTELFDKMILPIFGKYRVLLFFQKISHLRIFYQKNNVESL